jgi:3-hydroxyacyl-CoA dehydrogenase
MASIEKTYKSSSAYKSGKQTDEQVKRLTDLVKCTTEYATLSTADIVIEAGFEDMNIKKQIFANLDKVCKDTAILATNTSYLDIDEIASATSRSSSVIGARKFVISFLTELPSIKTFIFCGIAYI